jgi:hypothetical protein
MVRIPAWWELPGNALPGLASGLPATDGEAAELWRRDVALEIWMDAEEPLRIRWPAWSMR